MKKIILGISILVMGSVALAQLPDPGFKVDDKTAVLVTDPQIDFLSPDGVTWVARHGQLVCGTWRTRPSSYWSARRWQHLSCAGYASFLPFLCRVSLISAHLVGV